MRHLDRSARFDLAERSQQHRRVDLADRQFPEVGKNVLPQPRFDYAGIPFRPGAASRFDPFLGDILEGILAGFLLLTLFCPADRAGIAPGEQISLGIIAPFSRIGKFDEGVGATGKQFLLAVESVGQPPELAAFGRHKDEQAAAIRLLDRAGVGLESADGGVCQHVGICDAA
ncbi:MAG TPA: hypothetical protein PK479_03105 [Novosphingobium sp.]|nr:hypothetical protein [Novosphingobium sp.]